MKRILHILDIDGTTLNTLERISDFIDGYNPNNQIVYEISKDVLSLFGLKEFYNEDEININNNLINFINELAKKENEIHHIVFISLCLSDEIAKVKRNLVINILNKDLFNNIESFDLENINTNPQLANILKDCKSFDEIYGYDDAPSRLLEYINFKKVLYPNIKIVPIKYRFNENLIKQNNEYIFKTIKIN